MDAPNKKEPEGNESMPPGHQMMHNLTEHHKSMLDGVAEGMPMVELPELRESIMGYAGKCHKAMEELHKKHAKAYGMKMPDWPDGLEKPKEKAAGEGSDSVDDLEGDLATDELDSEEELTEEEEKAYAAILKDEEAIQTKNAADEQLLAEVSAT